MKSVKLIISPNNNMLKMVDRRCIRRIKKNPHVIIRFGLYYEEINKQYYFSGTKNESFNNILTILSLPDIKKIYLRLASYDKFYKPKKIILPMWGTSFSDSSGLEAYIPFKSWKEASIFKLKYQ